MIGSELIEWIHDNNAEDLLVLVDYRDSGGSYHEAGEANPELSQVIGRGIPYDNDYDYVFPCKKPNAIVL